MKKEASYYIYKNNEVICELCPHRCRIKDGGHGFCLARKREGEKLYSENYGVLTAIHLDPIEKKPLKKYKRGADILSIGSYGCNFKCGFCQNSDISQFRCDERVTSVKELVKYAYELKKSGNIGIAYTYNEPTVYYEYVYESAKLLKEKYEMDNILVTNGYINKKPLVELIKYIDAANVDLKSFNDDFYRSVCKSSLAEVKRNLQIFYENCHLEITNLVIEGYNDSSGEISKLCEFIASISNDIPLHLSRFFPAYRFSDRASTSYDTMYKAKETADKYLNTVYLGNMP